MTTAPVSNGKPQRKQLSEQLDRFDAILDGLSEGLTEAIAEAARTGTRLAVRDAIVEILTDSTLRAQLHEATASSAPVAPVAERPSFWARLKERAGQCVGAIRRTIANGVDAVRSGVGRLRVAFSNPLHLLRILGSVRHFLTLGISVGAAVALVSYVAPHELSALASGVCAGAAAVALRISGWTRRTFHFLTPA